MSEENISLPVAQALASALEKIEAYVPTEYVDNSEPDIDAEHLNHAEQGIMRVTNLLNAAVDVIQGQESRLEDTETKVGTAALTGGMTDLSSGVNSLYSNLTNMKPAHYSGMSALVGTLTRNSSVISGKLISLAITILSPINSTVAGDTALFRIQGNVVNTIGFVLLGTQTVGYVYAGSYQNGYTNFFIRTALGNPAVTANTEIFIIANIELA